MDPKKPKMERAMRLRLMCGLAALSLLVPAAAEARKTGHSSGYYEEQYETKGPQHGYSGWVWGGRRSYYCDYQRLPNRECVTLKSGKQRCKVTSWTLKQYCY